MRRSKRRLVVATLAIVLLISSILLALVAGGLGTAANVAQIVGISEFVVALAAWACRRPHEDKAHRRADTRDALEDKPDPPKSQDPPPKESRAAIKVNLPDIVISVGPVALTAVVVAILINVVRGAIGGDHSPVPPVACDLASPGNAVFVASARANSPTPGWSDRLAAIAAYVAEPAARSTYGLVSVDGAPRVVSVSKYTGNSQSHELFERDRDHFLQGFAQAFTNEKATHPEADVLTALDRAAQLIKASGNGGTLVLADSGLATTGAVNFTERGMLDASADEVAEYLRDTGSLPDFRGMDVVLVGIGETSGDQKPLRPAQRAHLVSMWKAIVLAGGAKCVDSIDTAPLAGSADRTLPPVSTIQVPAVPAVSVSSGNDVPEPLVLPDDAELGFKADSAQLLNEDAAARSLATAAQWLAADPHRHASVVGTSARVGPLASQIQLSSARAHTIASLLERLGVMPQQLDVKGVGSEYDGYVPDVDQSGRTIPGAAQANRLVLVSFSVG